MMRDEQVAGLLTDLCRPLAPGEDAQARRDAQVETVRRLKAIAPEALVGLQAVIQARTAERAIEARAAGRLN